VEGRCGRKTKNIDSATIAPATSMKIRWRSIAILYTKRSRLGITGQSTLNGIKVFWSWASGARVCWLTAGFKACVCADGLRPGRNCYPAAARGAGYRLELEVQALINQGSGGLATNPPRIAGQSPRCSEGPASPALLQPTLGPSTNASGYSGRSLVMRGQCLRQQRRIAVHRRSHFRRRPLTESNLGSRGSDLGGRR
jgi:hypothetical protein